MTTSVTESSETKKRKAERLSAIRTVIQQMSSHQATLRDNWCLQDDAAQCLGVLTHLSHATTAIEVGTSIGFSGLHMISGMLHNSDTPKLHTIDGSQERLAIAQQHFEDASLTNNLEFELHQGDAITMLQELCKANVKADLMFIDARKSEYVDYLKLAEVLLKPNGVLIADNTESHQKQMETFLNAVEANPLWHTASVPSWSGFTVSVMIKHATS